MAVRKRGKSWLATMELGRDPLTGRRRRTHVTAATRREAELEAARLRHEVAEGLDLEPTKITVAQYLSRWLGSVKSNLAPATYRRYEDLLRLHVMPYVGAVALSKLRPLQVQQMYARLQDGISSDGRGLAPRTRLHVHRVLSTALAQAVRWQIISRNVCQAVDPPKASRAEVSVLGPDEARRLLEVAEARDSVWGDAVVLALHTGLRQGELLGLRWQDFDEDRGRLTVYQALQYLPGKGMILQQPKTNRSRRTIPLGSTVLAALARLRRRQLEKRLALGAAYKDLGLVFTTALGTPIGANNLRRAFRRIVAQAEIGSLRFHDLRHTHATLLLARGVHPKVVSERLGHANIGITLDTYSHVLPNLQEEATRDLDAWLAGRA